MCFNNHLAVECEDAVAWLAGWKFHVIERSDIPVHESKFVAAHDIVMGSCGPKRYYRPNYHLHNPERDNEADIELSTAMLIHLYPCDIVECKTKRARRSDSEEAHERMRR